MALVHGYSSDEDAAVHQDAFNLAAVSKRQGFQDVALSITPQAAPDVLAQVGLFPCSNSPFC
jgi:hypothetical protein